MAQAYCDACAAEVTVRGRRCLAGHRIRNLPRDSRPGRHRAGRHSRPVTVRPTPTRILTLVAAIERLGHVTLDLGERMVRSAGPRLTEAGKRIDETVDRTVQQVVPVITGSARAVTTATNQVLEQVREAPEHPGRSIPEPGPAPADPPMGGWFQPEWPEPSGRSPGVGLPVLELFGLAEPERHYDGSTGAEAVLTEARPKNHNGVATRVRPADFWERLPQLADFTEEHEVEVDTGSLIQRLWDFSSEEEQDVSPDWQPEGFSSEAGSRRTFRWSVVLLALLLAVGALALLILAIRVPENRAANLSSRYSDAITALHEVLPAARQAAGLVTDPAMSAEALSPTAAPLARFEARARELAGLADEPLSTPPPLASNQPIEALRPVRERLQQAAQRATETQARLDLVLDYRLLADRAFRLPSLPLTASQEQVSELNAQLSVVLSDSIDLVGRLPDDPALADHKARLDELLGELETFQAAYLNAVRQGDVETADRLIEEMRTAIAGAEGRLEPGLEQIRSWAQERFDEIDQLLTEASTSLGQAPG